MYEGTRYAPTLHSSGSVQRPDGYTPATDCKIKAPTAVGRMGLVGLRFLSIRHEPPDGGSDVFLNIFNGPTAILPLSRRRSADDC
jgi:hypothetical protein